MKIKRNFYLITFLLSVFVINMSCMPLDTSKDKELMDADHNYKQEDGDDNNQQESEAVAEYSVDDTETLCSE